MKYKNFSIVILTLLLTACGEQATQEEKLIRPVKFHKIGYVDGDVFRSFTGTSKTDKVIHLSFRASGVLSELHIKLGQEVKAGDLLAKLDNVQARLNYENAISSKNSAQSQMRTAKLDLDRIRSLFEKGASSLREFEAAKNSYKTAQQNYQSASRSVDIQAEQVNYGFLYAPEDGVISSVNAEVNENITMGSSIAVLNSGTDMEISLGVPESVINFITKGMPVEVTFSSLPDKVFSGQTIEVSPTLDNNTATYPVIVVVNNPTSDVKSGMSANVKFRVTSQGLSERLVVPTNAVGEDADGQFVFLLTPVGDTMSANKQHVKIGQLTADGFEILSGLKSGDRIATAGLQTLLDGQTVELQ